VTNVKIREEAQHFIHPLSLHDLSKEDLHFTRRQNNHRHLALKLRGNPLPNEGFANREILALRMLTCPIVAAGINESGES